MSLHLFFFLQTFNTSFIFTLSHNDLFLFHWHIQAIRKPSRLLPNTMHIHQHTLPYFLLCVWILMLFKVNSTVFLSHTQRLSQPSSVISFPLLQDTCYQLENLWYYLPLNSQIFPAIPLFLYLSLFTKNSLKYWLNLMMHTFNSLLKVSSLWCILHIWDTEENAMHTNYINNF